MPIAQLVALERFVCRERPIANNQMSEMATANINASKLKLRCDIPDKKPKRSLILDGLSMIIATQPSHISPLIKPNSNNPNQLRAPAVPRFKVSILPPAIAVKGNSNGSAKTSFSRPNPIKLNATTKKVIIS